jgi:hypothetical protein
VEKVNLLVQNFEELKQDISFNMFDNFYNQFVEKNKISDFV